MISRRLLRTLIAAALVCGPFMGWGTDASAQNALARDDEDGWIADFVGLRHFSGMRCPDVVGSFFRTKALPAASDRMAGCIYTSDDGMTAVLRQHVLGTGTAEAEKFLNSYEAAGFRRITMTGVANSGISFITRDWTQAKQCETLWRFSGIKADFTLWLHYTLPGEETLIGPAVAAFTEVLNRQN